VTFEYEMRSVKEHEDLKLVTPVCGEILGMTHTPIVFQFKP
jgi:hypothetical protein